jgi:hypothetical protein
MAKKSVITAPKIIKVAGLARPLSQEKARSGIAALNESIVGRHERLSKERRRASRESLKAMAPLLKLMRSDKGAHKAVQNLRRMAEGRSKSKLLRPAVLQKVEQHTRAGSIINFITPPYDLSWGANSPQNDTTWGSSVVEQLKVSNSVDVYFSTTMNVRSGGNAWASAGLGTIFVPAGQSTTWVRIGAAAPYTWQYSDWSGGSPAHSNGFIAIYVQSFDRSGNNPKDELDRIITVFGDDVTLYDSHSDEQGGYYPNDTYFMADSSRYYLIWAWCSTFGDGSADQVFGSTAYASINVSLPYMVIEQWT